MSKSHLWFVIRASSFYPPLIFARRALALASP